MSRSAFRLCISFFYYYYNFGKNNLGFISDKENTLGIKAVMFLQSCICLTASLTLSLNAARLVCLSVDCPRVHFVFLTFFKFSSQISFCQLRNRYEMLENRTCSGISDFPVY